MAKGEVNEVNKVNEHPLNGKKVKYARKNIVEF